MTSKLKLSVFIMITALLLAQPLWAESVYTCPEISKAQQVGSCPSDDELAHLYKSTCGTNKGGGDPKLAGICRSFDDFKKKKNYAFWESKDGAFSGYISCAASAEKIKQAKLIKIGVGTQRVMDKVVCSYEGGAKLTLRTRASCTVPGSKVLGRLMGVECSADGSNCKAICK